MQKMKYILIISLQKEIELAENLDVFGKCLKEFFVWKSFPS